MVDMYGKWIEEKDYSVCPENKWCDMDYMANWIRSIGYEPKTSMENLILMVFAHYESCLEEEGRTFYTDITKSENGDGWMVSIEDVSCYVKDNGGLEEFDYEC